MDEIREERLDHLLAGFRDVHVLVVGDLMLDVYLRGGASRISPEAPVPVVRIAEEWVALGGAANVAANVVAAGARCTVVGVVGDDASGDRLRRVLDGLGISDDGLIVEPGRPTTVKTRVLVRNQQVARYDREADEDADVTVEARLIDAVERLAPEASALVAEDYNKGVLTAGLIEAVMAQGREGGHPVVVDPKSRNFFAYAGATVFKPNLAELSAALREPVLYDEPEWLERTRRRLGCRHLLLTLGEHGMALTSEDGGFLRVPAMARSVYDVSGAGDTVTAVVAVALAAGASPGEAALLANAAAGVEVGKAGVATVSPAELRAAVRDGARRIP